MDGIVIRQWLLLYRALVSKKPIKQSDRMYTRSDYRYKMYKLEQPSNYLRGKCCSILRLMG